MGIIRTPHPGYTKSPQYPGQDGHPHQHPKSMPKTPKKTPKQAGKVHHPAPGGKHPPMDGNY